MKRLPLILIIEVQLVLFLLIFCTLKLSKIDQTVKRENRILQEVLKSSNFEDVQQVRDLDIVIGDENAPVSIIMYTKLSCEYCVSFFETTFPELKTSYIATGIVKFIVRFLPSGNDETAIHPIRYSYCMYDLALFEEFNKRLMLDKENNPDIAYIKAFVGTKGVDTTGLSDCLNSDHLDNFIEDMAEKAHQAGIHGSPLFVINGEVLRGNRKFIKFKEMIESTK